MPLPIPVLPTGAGLAPGTPDLIGNTLPAPGRDLHREIQWIFSVTGIWSYRHRSFPSGSIEWTTIRAISLPEDD